MDEVAVMVSSMERPVRVRPVARIGQVMVIVSGVLVVIFVVVVAVVIARRVVVAHGCSSAQDPSVLSPG